MSGSDSTQMHMTVSTKMVMASLCMIMLLIPLLGGWVIAQANSNLYVYRIKSDGCTSVPEARRQTGFRVNGQAGIVTALHGVADCKTVSAVADDGTIFTDLAVVAVDIDRDVALLSSSVLAADPQAGLMPSTLTTQEILSNTFTIVGYPLGLEKQDIDSKLLVRQIERLDDVVPDQEEPTEFIKRKSPSLDIEVLNLQAILLPGHSGAPVLDPLGQVVAMGDGGLRGGTVGRSWAIPWSDVVLQPVSAASIQKRLKELATKDTAALAFSSTYPAQGASADQSDNEPKTYLVQVVDDKGSGIANAEVLLTHNQGYTINLTDSKGFAVFQLAGDVDYRMSRLLVEAVGFAAYSRYVGNVSKKENEVVRLSTAVQPPITPVESLRWCEFALTILDRANETPITNAEVYVTLGSTPSSGYTDANGFYGSKLPCATPSSVSIKVRIIAEGYKTHTETVPLVGDVKEIRLATKPTLTPTSTPQPIAQAPTPQPPAVATCQISVDPALQAMWRADLGCALENAHITWASYTPYERGLMMWREDTRQIYGFFQDNGWQAVADRFQEGMPDMPNPNRGNPPPGLVHPIRGTGLVWATNETFYQNLGWAKTQQRGFCARVQNFANGFIVQESGLTSCFDGKSSQEQASRAREAEFDFRFLTANYSNQWSRN